MREYYHKNKKKWNSRAYAYYKLRKNLIKKNTLCEKCGKRKATELHHNKYNKNSADIDVLCKKCHRETHSNKN